MTALLVAVTFGALGLAGALLFYVLRLTREERDRSDARAAALTELIGRGCFRFVGAPTEAPSLDRFKGRCLAAPQSTGSARRPAAAGAGHWRAGRRAGADGHLRLEPAGHGRGSGVSCAAPLELVSLRHERQGDTLIVSGLVRNPHAGRTITGLSAVAFTFDRQGTFLTSGRVQLDFPQLGAGDESPFSISVPQSAGVGRYRVSFRTEDGVVPHLDRREPAALSSAKAQVTR